MALPRPEPGLVIRFNYLWRREQIQGRENARYPRPCAVVLTYRRTTDDVLIVMVVPITHSVPLEGVRALELPAKVKQHLGLDSERSWIVVDEVNEFAWPGFDLEPTAKGEISYGFLPPVLFLKLRAMVRESVRAGVLGRTIR